MKVGVTESGAAACAQCPWCLWAPRAGHLVGPGAPDTTPHLTIGVRMQRPTAEGSAVVSHNHVPMAGTRMHRDAVRCTRKIRALRVCALTTPQPLALWGNGPLAIPYTINLVTFQP